GQRGQFSLGNRRGGKPTAAACLDRDPRSGFSPQARLPMEGHGLAPAQLLPPRPAPPHLAAPRPSPRVGRGRSRTFDTVTFHTRADFRATLKTRGLGAEGPLGEQMSGLSAAAPWEKS